MRILKSRNHESFWTIGLRYIVNHQFDPIAKLWIESWTSKGDYSPKPRYAKSRHRKSRDLERIVSRPSKRIGGNRSKCHHFDILEFGISEVLLMKVMTLHDKSPEILKRSQSSIHLDTWRRSRKPSASQLPGFQVDRGFGVASRKIVKQGGPSILSGRVATI
jgi:hypothetical protein